MKILEYMEVYGYEQLVVCQEPSVGLRAFIAIHDTTLGPHAAGSGSGPTRPRRTRSWTCCGWPGR